MKKFFSFFAAVLFAGSMMAATPLTCAEAAAQAANAGDEEYEVTGFVTSIKTAYSEQYNNISFWMADTKDGGEVLQAFRCTPESADKLPAAGDKVTVTGKLTVYNETPEFAQGCTCVIVEKAETGEGEGEGGEESAALLSIDFTQGQGDWTIVDKVLPEGLSYVWQQDSRYGMKASAFANSTRYATESWLISPTINLSEVTKATLSINQAVNYGAPADFLAIKATTDGEQWADVELEGWPEGTSWTWADGTADLSAYAGKENVVIAFVYTSTEETAPTWEIKTLAITVEGGEGEGGEGEGGEVTDPTNCAEAAEAALSVENNNDLYNDGKEYTIEGYVTGIKTEYSEQYHNISFWMADAVDGGEVLQAYRAACESEADAPAVGDKVAVTGQLTKFNTTPEFAAGCTFVIIEKGESGEESVTLLDVDFTVGQGEWTIEDKVLPEDLTAVWQQDSRYGMKASGFANQTKYATESWLISPAINLSEVSKAILSINQAFNYGTPADFLSIKATKDGEQWTDVVLDVWPEGTNWTYIDSEADLSDFVGEQNVKIAFVYTSSADAAGTWEIKTVKVTNGEGSGEVPPVEGDVLTCAEAVEIAANNDGKEYTAKGYVTEIVTAYSEQYGNISFWMADAKDGGQVLQAYRCKPESADKLPEVGDLVEVTGKLKIYTKDDVSTPEFDANCTCKIIEKGEGGGEQGDALTCAQAVEIAAASDGQEHTAVGYVTEIKTPYSEQYGNITFWMADAKDGGEVLQAYRCVPESADKLPEVGDKVRVTGTLTMYNSTPEFEAGCTCVIVEKGEGSDPLPTEIGEVTTCAEAAEALAGVQPDVQVNNGADFTLRGYVTEIATEYSEQFGNISFWMADTKDGGQVLQAWRCVPESADKLPEVGDFVEVTGKLKRHGSIPEFDANCTCTIIEKGEGGGEDEDHPFDEDADFSAVFASYTIDDSDLEEYGNIYVQATDDEGYYIVLDITLPEGATELVAGTYPVDDSYEYPYQTVTAGIYSEESAYPSFAAVLGEEGIENIWWIVAGEVVIDEDLNITVDAVNSLGREVVALLSADGGDAVETTKVDNAAVKRIENATLIIERNGVRYNVMGQVVR